jgi:hypothetical protein
MSKSQFEVPKFLRTKFLWFLGIKVSGYRLGFQGFVIFRNQGCVVFGFKVFRSKVLRFLKIQI